MLAVSENKKSFTTQYAIAPDQIFLVRGRDGYSRPAWYYIKVDRNKRDVFCRGHGALALDLSDYGSIIYSGYGAEPPRPIREYMQLAFGFSE